MPFLDISGRRLYYAEHKSKRVDPVLILLHGAGGSHLVWPPELRTLPAMRTLAVDLPGHGRSTPPGRRLIAHYASEVQGLIRALDLNNVFVLGHSMGGAIALEIALNKPPGLKGVIILGAAARMPVSPALLAGCLENLAQAADFIVENSFNEPHLILLERSREQILATGAVTTYGDFLACKAFDVGRRLDTIDVPALVIGGAEDRMMPDRFVAGLATSLPGGRFARLAGAGHFMMLEQPQEIARLVSEFVAEVSPETRGAGPQTGE